MPPPRKEKTVRKGIIVSAELNARHEEKLPEIMKAPGKKNLLSKRVEKMMKEDLEDE